MKKLLAVAASAVVAVGTLAGPGVASHKSKSPHANPPGQQDCGIEVDLLGICLL